MQACERDERSVADRRRLFEAHAGRLVRQRAVLAHADELGVRAALYAEDLVADRELVTAADRLDLAGELGAEDPPPRPQQAGEEAGENGSAARSRSRSG